MATPRVIHGKVLTAYTAKTLKEAAAELAQRRCEALRLFEPLPVQQAFLASVARTRLARGSNRSGKTLVAAVEVARAATGQDPHNKYPKQNGRYYCVAKDLKELGEVMYPKLFRAGAFKIIRDEQTGLWRTFRLGADAARKDEAKLAPPLIPPRLVKSISWHNKAEGQPSLVKMHNGWELSFYSSNGAPPHGADIDGFWFDEEILNESWYGEMSARVLDRHGRGIWSATPQAGTDQLYDLHERAEKEVETRLRVPTDEPPGVEEFVLTLADNPHISARAKANLEADLTEDEKLVRVGGEFASATYRVYPEFSIAVHGEDYFTIPTDWTRYAAIDPGLQICAVLFGAVPPPRRGDFLYLYDELYIDRCDAEKFAQAMSVKCRDQDFEAFLIDGHGAGIGEIGSGKTVGRQYSAALAKYKVRSRTTGSDFRMGSDDIQAGVLAVKGALRVRADGTTKLRVMRGRLPWFEAEIKRYHNKRQAGHVKDEPDQRRNSHLMDDLRYLVSANLQWVKPTRGSNLESPAYRAFMRLNKKTPQDSYIRLGPGR